MGMVFEKGEVRKRSPVGSEIAIPDVRITLIPACILSLSRSYFLAFWGLLFLALTLTLAPARFLSLSLVHILFFLDLVIILVIVLPLLHQTFGLSENIT